MKLRGRPGEFSPHQWANDWITITELPGRVASPTEVTLTTPEEMRDFLETRGTLAVGRFWDWWSLGEDGRFTPTEINPRSDLRRTERRARRTHYPRRHEE